MLWFICDNVLINHLRKCPNQKNNIDTFSKKIYNELIIIFIGGTNEKGWVKNERRIQIQNY